MVVPMMGPPVTMPPAMMPPMVMVPVGTVPMVVVAPIGAMPIAPWRPPVAKIPKGPEEPPIGNAAAPWIEVPAGTAVPIDLGHQVRAVRNWSRRECLRRRGHAKEAGGEQCGYENLHCYPPCCWMEAFELNLSEPAMKATGSGARTPQGDDHGRPSASWLPAPCLSARCIGGVPVWPALSR